jgi:hypothetical protein
VSRTVRNFINKITPLYYHHAPPSTSSHECPLRSPRTQPVLASLPLSIKHNSCLMMYDEKGYRMSCSQKDRAALSLQPKLKACCIASPNKHNHKLNTSNLEVYTLTVYQYIVQANFFTLFFPCNFASLSAEHIYLIWLRTRIIGNTVFSVPQVPWHKACYNVVSAESKKQDLYSPTYYFIGGNHLSSLQMNMHVSGINPK